LNSPLVRHPNCPNDMISWDQNFERAMKSRHFPIKVKWSVEQNDLRIVNEDIFSDWEKRPFPLESLLLFTFWSIVDLSWFDRHVIWKPEKLIIDLFKYRPIKIGQYFSGDC
jgi:hypothetical protein